MDTHTYINTYIYMYMCVCVCVCVCVCALFATLRRLFIYLPFSVRYGKKRFFSIVRKFLMVQYNLRLYFIYLCCKLEIL